MKIDVNISPNTGKHYSVFINHLGNELDRVEVKGKVAIITNPKVSNLHLKSLQEYVIADEIYVITIPDGEQYKTLKTVENILNQLFKLKFNRKSTLIAFGGGVIGDITGFCASIYERGIDFIQVPTTLLAQVDASVGGKTGVNNSYGKNLIGSFHQPKAVYCETKFLKTLPKREYISGIAEILKISVMLDEDFFNWLENVDLYDDDIIVKAVEKSIKAKAKIVEEDEKEKGKRAALNYGHTFAHAIEHQTNYQKFLHGEAVAVGINMANFLAIELGLLDLVEQERISEILSKYELPQHYRITNSEKFYETLFLDKKSSDENVLFVVPNHIGKNIFKDDVPKETILKVLGHFSV